MPDVEGRVAHLESRLDDHTRALQDLRGDIAALRADNAAAIADLRAAHSADTAMLLGAIRDLREETVRRFEQMTVENNARFHQIESRFQQVDARFLAMDDKIDRHFALLVGIQVATISAFVSALVALYFR